MRQKINKFLCNVPILALYGSVKSFEQKNQHIYLKKMPQQYIIVSYLQAICPQLYYYNINIRRLHYG